MFRADAKRARKIESSNFESSGENLNSGAVSPVAANRSDHSSTGLCSQVKAFALQTLGAEMAAQKLAGTLSRAGDMQKTANLFAIETVIGLINQLWTLVRAVDRTSSVFRLLLGSNVYVEDRWQPPLLAD